MDLLWMTVAVLAVISGTGAALLLWLRVGLSRGHDSDWAQPASSTMDLTDALERVHRAGPSPASLDIPEPPTLTVRVRPDHEVPAGPGSGQRASPGM